MKKYLFYLFLSVITSAMFSQSHWDSLPGGVFQNVYSINSMYVDSEYLYVSGDFNKVAGIPMKGIARWNGIKWDSMGGGIENFKRSPGNVNAMAIYHQKLYVAGVFPGLGNVSAYSVGRWDGTAWDSIPIKPFKHDSAGIISALTVINDKLYMGGDFDTVAGIPCNGITYWDDTNWHSMNFPKIIKGYVGIAAICQYKGSIYVAGNFSNDTIGSILRWDNTGWHSVDTGIKNAQFMTDMAVYKGELYVAGYFFQSDGNVGQNIQKWNGTKWNDVGGESNYAIQRLLVYNNKLYALGTYTFIGGFYAPGIAEWDSTQWCRPDTLGAFWDNGDEPTVGCIYKDSLFVGGMFTEIDGRRVDYYVTEWVGGNYVDSCIRGWPTGLNNLKIKNEVTVYPNPNNGQFTLSLSNVNSVSNIEIYNVLGEKVYTEALLQHQNNNAINLTGQSNGVYLYRVITETGNLVGEGKVVLQK